MGLAKIESGTGNQKVKVTPLTDVTVTVFFDGTGNNMYNTDTRGNAPKGTKFDEGSSYENAYSNVARLFKNYKSKKPFVYGVYIEGMGTFKDEPDDVLNGEGLGRGKSGIPARVAKACQLVTDNLKAVPKINGQKKVGTLTVDVFGFSRGAAAARHFIYEITKAAYKSNLKIVSAGEGDPGFTYYTDEYHNETPFEEFPMRGYLGAYCNQQKVHINNVAIRFAGLFDTVASYSESLIPSAVISTSPTDTPKPFTDDTKELKLNAVALARKAVQLSAADEHRANFPLTNINSTGRKGIQLSLPGVHSDVGGSYENEKDNDYIERLMQIDGYNAINPIANVINGAKEIFNDKLDEQAAWLVEEGWYKRNDLSKHTVYGGGLLAVQHCLSGTKPALPNTYSFIPLYIMCQFALEVDAQTNPIPFDIDGLRTNAKTSIKGNKLLEQIYDRLNKYAFKNGDPVQLHYTKPHFEIAQHSQSANNAIDNTYAKPQVLMTNTISPEDKDLINLRYSYLHFSAKYDRATLRVMPNYPRMVDGKRERLVLPG
ncbi:DUF2235 domain-containing protein [Mucilaginibacter sp. L196]|uniref:T6SS phospholipase effector Tle1-like catalytic domain-containing protein n=1 Tax=Mucilaginibacter sp. L196 TaxID=1641870 RepID=UPI00131CE5AB|nr:DUF2235 domain-containing protein [Mucilaginibacter sp. L196]